jgi:hypothetical protein
VNKFDQASRFMFKLQTDFDDHFESKENHDLTFNKN